MKSNSNFENQSKGAIAWMARNSIASNLLMVILLLAGFFSILQTKQEVLPEFSVDIIAVSVGYPGASPEEVEQGIVLAGISPITSFDLGTGWRIHPHGQCRCLVEQHALFSSDGVHVVRGEPNRHRGVLGPHLRRS